MPLIVGKEQPTSVRELHLTEGSSTGVGRNNEADVSFLNGTDGRGSIIVPYRVVEWNVKNDVPFVTITMEVGSIMDYKGRRNGDVTIMENSETSTKM